MGDLRHHNGTLLYTSSHVPSLDCTGNPIYKLTDCEGNELPIYTHSDLQAYVGQVVSWNEICWIVSVHTDPAITVSIETQGLAEFDDCEDCLASYTLTPCNIDCPNTDTGDCGGGAVVYTYAYRSGLQPSDAGKVVKASVSGVTKCYTVAAGHTGSPTFSDVTIGGRYDDCENTEHTGCCDPCYKCGDCEFEGINDHSTIEYYSKYWFCTYVMGTNCGTFSQLSVVVLTEGTLAKNDCSSWSGTCTTYSVTAPDVADCSEPSDEYIRNHEDVIIGNLSVTVTYDCDDNDWGISGVPFAGGVWDCSGGTYDVDSACGATILNQTDHERYVIELTDECDSGAVG